MSSNTQTAELEPKVMAVLACLYEQQGLVISQQEIFNEVWPGRVYNQSLVQRAIALIRKALGEDATSAKWLITYPTKGYCLKAQPHINHFKRCYLGAVVLLLVLVLLAVYVNNETLQAPRYHTLSTLLKTPLDSYSLSQNEYADWLYLSEDENQYRLWLKNGQSEKVILTSSEPLLFAFWYQGAPVVVKTRSDSGYEFIKVAEQHQHLFKTQLLPAVKPQVIENKIYFSTAKHIYQFDGGSQSLSIVSDFSHAQQIVDMTHSDKHNMLAVLVSLGQAHYKVITVTLDTLATEDIFQDFGVYHSIDWHSSKPLLLLSKGSELLQLTLAGNTTTIAYPTDKHIATAQYSRFEDAIYLRQKSLQIGFTLYANAKRETPLLKVNNVGADLFPTSNPKNNKRYVYQSDRSGTNELYLVDAEKEEVLATTQHSEHFNGFSWSVDGKKLAYAINQRIMVHDSEQIVDKVTLTNTAYIRAWYSDGESLLVNQMKRGEPFPSRLYLGSAKVQQLTHSSASCAVLDNEGNLYYVQGKMLKKQALNGDIITLHELTGMDEYDDLFINNKYLYASVGNDEVRYIQQLNLRDYSLKRFAISKDMILAGVTQNDATWFYDNLKVSSRYMKLH
ncbi:hypothetical protein HG263_20420 [Pseudoalteromonas sp. JBTF-M23]|uniref:OmpR/PhoB-type domain-containing protein n=1 Tax=Pseudoalteromonas caenipelagi TaxID=2726988 RepID=A0A849VKA1_9GAMM|nr:hypothetical protein [Pseudoalteromonas caenipelagi]